MCGRYASSRQPDELIDEFGVTLSQVDQPIGPDFNVAPTKPVYAVLERAAPDAEVSRQLRILTWGLVPSWAKDPKIAGRMINARMETLAQKPAFRRAFAARRCLLPADGYFEWYPTGQTGPRGNPVKQPFFIRPRDSSVMAMAGLYELWKDPDSGVWRWTCTVITTDAEDSVGQIHDRMPLMVDRSRWDAWLDPAAPGSTDLLTPAAPGRLEAYPVSTLVSNVRNNGQDLIRPLEASR